MKKNIILIILLFGFFTSLHAQELLQDNKKYICTFYMKNMGGMKQEQMTSPAKSETIRKGNKLFVENEEVMNKISENKYASSNNVAQFKKSKNKILIVLKYNDYNDLYLGSCE